MSDLANINVVDFKKRVQEHVVNTFGALIPDEQFSTLVDAEIRAFFETTQVMTLTQVTGSYGGRVDAVKTTMTPFRAVVWAKLQLMCNSKLDEFFRSDQAPVEKLLAELVRIPELGEHQLSQAQQLMLAMAGQMFSNVMKTAGYSATGSVIQAFRNLNMHDVASQIVAAQSSIAAFQSPETLQT